MPPPQGFVDQTVLAFATWDTANVMVPERPRQIAGPFRCCDDQG